ncbi:MAG: efflux RND transporter periplasmic adaptor subunit [Parvularculaceae bacterium]|nr:efflux RND transporter periplasmic adaptor subunit [Parvularculaceae bacterium]
MLQRKTTARARQVDIRTDQIAEGSFAQDISGAAVPASAPKRPPAALLVGAPLAVLAVAVGVIMLLSATARKPEKNVDPPLPIAVEIATVRSVTTSLEVTAQGEVKSKTEADVAARVGGQIVEVAPQFEPGASVRSGDLLVRIDPAEYRLAVERARSQVSRARENLARMRSEADLAKADWQELGMAGTPSDLTLLKPQMASATADLRTAEAAVREAELALERTEIRAPFDGRVKSRRVDVGDFVAPGTPVASLFAVDVAQVRIPLTERDLSVLGVGPGFGATPENPGPVALVRGTGAHAGAPWSGHLALVEASFDPATRLVYGLVEVKDPFAGPTPLAPGMFVSVDLKGRTEEALLAIPRGAYKKNEVVYTVDAEGAIRGHRLAAAHATASEVFFRTGLAAGDRVVVSYIPSPRDGMKVRDLNAPLPPKAEGADASRTKGDTKAKKTAKAG